jgi:hypothetical protein
MKGKHQRQIVAQQRRLESDRVTELEARVRELEQERETFQARVREEGRVAIARQVAQAKEALHGQLEAEIARANRAERESERRVLRMAEIIHSGYVTAHPGQKMDVIFKPGEWEELGDLCGGTYGKLQAVLPIFPEEQMDRGFRRMKVKGVKQRLVDHLGPDLARRAFVNNVRVLRQRAEEAQEEPQP